MINGAFKNNFFKDKYTPYIQNYINSNNKIISNKKYIQKSKHLHPNFSLQESYSPITLLQFGQ